MATKNQQEVQRGKNFTNTEEEFLGTLIQKCKSVMECKQTDSRNNSLKNSTWQKIEAKFNVGNEGDSFRCVKVLKTKYRNMKKGTKEKIASNKMQRGKTGGGSYTPIPFNAVDNIIMEVTDKNVMGFAKSSYDDDDEGTKEVEVVCVTEFNDSSGAYENHQFETIIKLQVPKPLKEVDHNEESNVMSNFEDVRIVRRFLQREKVTINLKKEKKNLLERWKYSNKWCGNTVGLLHTQRSECLRNQDSSEEDDDRKKSKRSKRCGNRISTWAAGKVALNEWQEKSWIEKHTLELKIMEAEHKAHMEREERICKLQEEELKWKINLLRSKKAHLDSNIKKALHLS